MERCGLSDNRKWTVGHINKIGWILCERGKGHIPMRTCLPFSALS
jgi:hypothetical protein